MGQFHYSMIIQWSDEDNKYIVTIPEFTRCKTHGGTYEEAIKNGQEAIEVCIEAEQALGRPLPQPPGLCIVTSTRFENTTKHNHCTSDTPYHPLCTLDISRRDHFFVIA